MKFFVFTTLLALASIFAFPNKGLTADVSFQISNQQSDPLGQVTVSTQPQNYYVNVPGNSTDSVTIADPAISITINGQTVPVGTNAIVQLASGKMVEVMWTSTTSVTVIDQGVLG